MITVIQKNEITEIETDGEKGGVLAAEAISVVRAMYDHLMDNNRVGAMIFESLLTDFVKDGTIFSEKYKGEKI